MGHVEYVVRDSAGNVKQYQQLDNEVVDKGDNCVITLAFGSTGHGCSSASTFQYIGISNATTGTITGTMTTIGTSGTSTDVAASGQDGIMATKLGAVSGSAGTDGSTVTIATQNPFTFDSETTTNGTNVEAAGLFDAGCSGIASEGFCNANASTMNMFAAQVIDVTVANGDSLDVTWTITVGDPN